MTVSPFSIYLSGECDADNPESPNENGLDKCFLLPEWDDTSKVTLTDGIEPENIFVNIKDIESVTINGDTIYRN